MGWLSAIVGVLVHLSTSTLQYLQNQLNNNIINIIQIFLELSEEEFKNMVNENILLSQNNYVCKFCGKQANHKQTIRRHIEAFHINFGEFPCEICGNVSKTRYGLVQHKRKYHVNL